MTASDPRTVEELLRSPECAIGECRNPVGDPREVCGPCLAAFGPYLRPATSPVPGAREFAALAAAGESRVREVLAQRRGAA